MKEYNSQKRQERYQKNREKELFKAKERYHKNKDELKKAALERYYQNYEENKRKNRERMRKKRSTVKTNVSKKHTSLKNEEK